MESNFKKLLLQRNVLDTLRVYLELTDDFLVKLKEAKLLTADELLVVQTLKWPSNRNELLQTLIRKDWPEEAFTLFCQILKETQNEQLVTLVVKKADVLIAEAERESIKSEESIKLNNTLDNELGPGVNMKTRSYVRQKLQEKDDNIRQLKAENEELRSHIKSLSEENHSNKERLQILDKVVTDTLATMPHELLEDGPGGFGQAMVGMRRTIDRQKQIIQNLNDEISELKANETQLRASITFLTEDNMLLKKAHGDIQEEMAKTKIDAEKKTAKLEQEWKWERATVLKLEKKLASTEGWFKDSVQTMEKEIAGLKEKLQLSEMQTKDAQTERNAAKEELANVQDRTRKLLSSLDLSNDITKSALSVEHARNISYVRRRRPTYNVISASSNTLTSSEQPLMYRRRANGVVTTSPPSTTDSNGAPSVASSKKIKIDMDVISENHVQIEEADTDCIRNLDQVPEITGNKQPVCATCGKFYDEVSNFDGACIHHQPKGVLLNEGTSLQVWSCCKSADTFKGCVKSRHVPRA